MTENATSLALEPAPCVRAAGPTLWGAAAFLPLLIATSCTKLDADDRYHLRTRRGDLLDELKAAYTEAGGADLGESCSKCVVDHCKKEMEQCSMDFACHRSAECELLQHDPNGLQDCLSRLLEMGVSTGKEEARPFRPVPPLSVRLRACVREHCAKDCEQARMEWECVDNYSHPLKKTFKVVVGVRFFPGYEPVHRAKVSRCLIAQECSMPRYTNDAGIVELEDDGYAEDDELVLKIEPPDGSGVFLTTYYYPAHFGAMKREPVAAYVVKRTFFGEALIARALILPDACGALDLPSAPDLTFQFKDWDGQVYSSLCENVGAEGCIWYADADGAKLGLAATDGHGGGIRLPGAESPRKVDVRVCNAEGQLVARREGFVMEQGAMTIARTWPLAEGEGEKGEPCVP